MISRKFFRRTLSMLFVAAIMLFASVTHAEIYTGEGSYVMSEGENLGVAKERAKADAMRNAAEKAGTYVKSYSRSKNFELEEDIIETMTANILKLIGNPNFLPYEQLDNLEGLLIHVIVQVQIDDSDINRWLNKDEQEKSMLVSQNEALRKSNEEQARQIAELKRQLAKSTTKEEKERITNEFANEDKIFLSNQKVEEAWKLKEQGNYKDSIKVANEAIQLHSNNSKAYFCRGISYQGLKQYEKAIQDHSKSIELNPNVDYVYNNRGVAYKNLGQYEKAIADFNKTIELNMNFVAAYINRGVAYNNLKQYERAVQDYDKAIALNPNYTVAYNNRGVAYMDGLKQYKRAIQDYDKAIQLNPNYTMAYNNRALAYMLSGNFKQAIADSTKAIQINPKYVPAYQLRGRCYQQLGDEEKAQEDFEKYKELSNQG